MRPWLKFGVLVLALLAAPVWFASCAGGNPAAAPSPPVELPAPAVIKFVSTQGLTVDVSSLSSGAAAMTASAAKTTQRTPDTTVTDETLKGIIRTGPFSTEFFNTTFLNPVLDGIEELEIPVIDPLTGLPTTRWCPHDPNNPTDPGCVFFTFSAATRYLAGPHAVKVDFGPFDLDNDSTAESCSGNALTPPVCIRLWLGEPALGVTIASQGATYVPTAQAYAPFIAGVFRRPPIYGTDPSVPIDIGAGEFRVKVDDFPYSGFPSGFRVRFHYRYSQGAAAPRESKDVVFFFETDKQSPTAASPCGRGCKDFLWHSESLQLGPRKVSQAAADSSRFAFEELLSSIPCFAGQGTECTCPGGGTVTVDAAGNYTLNGCANGVGMTFTGVLAPSGGGYAVNMPTFGDCTAVSGPDPLLAATCSGELAATCEGEAVTCMLAPNAETGACDAACHVPQEQVLKSLNLDTENTFDKALIDASHSCYTWAIFLPQPDAWTECQQQIRHLSQYVEGGDRWSGASLFMPWYDGVPLWADPVPHDQLFGCARLPLTDPCYTDPPDPPNCLLPLDQWPTCAVSLPPGDIVDNIYVDGNDYVTTTIEADVAFPTDFPATPTF